MAKKTTHPEPKPRVKSAEQKPLPTMEAVRHGKLDKLCMSIGDAREQANLARTDEEAGKQAALVYMAQNDITIYKHGGIELVRVPGHDALRVRLAKGDAEVSGGNDGGRSRSMTKALAMRPATVDLTLGKFTLTEVGIEVHGKPTFEEWQGVGDFIQRTHKAAGFWLADWLRYGDEQKDWRERIEAALDVTDLSEKTLINVRSVARIEPARRRADVEFSHHLEVAALEPEEQTEWLDKTAENGWSVRELRLELRASRRRSVIEGQATLQGMYRVIYADPPWLYSDSGPTEDGSLGKAERHYPGMTMEQLCKLPVKAHSMPNAVLFMWTTAPMLLLNPGPRDVLEAWGFTYKTNFVWDKVLGMPGHYSHVQHEHFDPRDPRERPAGPPNAAAQEPVRRAAHRAALAEADGHPQNDREALRRRPLPRAVRAHTRSRLGRVRQRCRPLGAPERRRVRKP